MTMTTIFDVQTRQTKKIDNLRNGFTLSTVACSVKKKNLLRGASQPVRLFFFFCFWENLTPRACFAKWPALLLRLANERICFASASAVNYKKYVNTRCSRDCAGRRKASLTYLTYLTSYV